MVPAMPITIETRLGPTSIHASIPFRPLVASTVVVSVIRDTADLWSHFFGEQV